MNVRKRTSRRDFIRIGLLGTSAALLAACGQQAPAAAPTAVPAAPGQFTNAQPVVQLTPTTAAAKPAEPAKPAEAPKPAEAQKPAAEAKPTEAPKPAEAAKPAAPVVGAVADVKQVPRNRTMVLSFAGTGAAEGRWTDYELWNRYAIGANMQNG